MDSCPFSQFKFSENYSYIFAQFFLVGFLSFLIYIFANCVRKKIWRCLTVSVEVIGQMECGATYYSQVIKWLSENSSSEIPHIFVEFEESQEETGKWNTSIEKSHAFEMKTNYYINGTWVQLHRSRLALRRYDCPYESLTLTSYRWNKSVLDNVLQKVKERVDNSRKVDGLTTRFYYADGGSWIQFCNSKRRRPISSVILNKQVTANLMQDVREFINCSDWYTDRGIPYRRGYLLYGPPGCGKSSLCRAMAGELGYDICMLSLSGKDLTDDLLNQLMNSTQENSIILLEDIDAAFPSREAINKEAKEKEAEASSGAGGALMKKCAVAPGGEQAYGGSNRVTFRGLLNAFDGVAATEGRILFMTTNYVERIDPALIRPGRVDMKIYIPFPADEEVESMFKRFYPEAEEEDVKKFVGIVRDTNKKDISMAMIQGLFMLYKNSFEDAIKNGVTYFKDELYTVFNPEGSEEKAEKNEDEKNKTENEK